MWKTTELFDDYTQWELAIQSTKIKLIELLGIKDEYTIETGLLLREKIAVELDKLYTYGLLLRELKVDNSHIHEKLDDIKKLYSIFNIYNEHLQKQLTDNKNEIFELLKSDIVLKRYRNDIVSFLNDTADKADFNEDIDVLYKKISPYDFFLEWYFSFDNIGKQKDGQNITEFNLLKLLKDSDRGRREHVYIAVEKFLKSISNTAAYILNSHLQLSNKIPKDRLLGIQNDSYVLTWNDMEEMKSSFTTLNKLIVKYKSNSLGIHSISYFDLYYLPNECCKIIDKDEAKCILIKSSNLLGKEISSIVIQAFEDNWINWENAGHFGQRSFSSYTTHPYIKVSWDGTLDSLFNLAHEIFGAAAQYLGSRAESFFNSELSILKTEFFSYLGTWSLYEYLKNHSEIVDSKLLKDKFVDFIKDVFISPYAYVYIENTLLLKSKYQKLTSEKISDLWYEFIYEFHDCEQFKHLEINRYNWVRNEHFYLKGYDVNYIIAFSLSLDYFYTNSSNEKLVSLLSEGELNTDNEFFKKLGFNTEIHEFLQESIEVCRNWLKGD